MFLRQLISSVGGKVFKNYSKIHLESTNLKINVLKLDVKIILLPFSLIVVINLLNRSFQGFDAGVAVDTPDRLIPIFTSRYCHSTIGIAVVLSVLV